MSNQWTFDSDSDEELENDLVIVEKDYYKILGVSKISTQEDIKKKYRLQAKQIHPDKHQDEKEKYNKLFQELCEAYSILSDPNKRKIYDTHGTRGLKHKTFIIPKNKKDFDLLFEMAFTSEDEEKEDKYSTLTKPQCLPLKYTLTLNHNEITHTVNFKYKKNAICKICNGSKAQNLPCCSKCDGKGYVKTWYPSITVKKIIDCEMCHSKGYIEENTLASFPCQKCNGKGKLIKQDWSSPHRQKEICENCKGCKKICVACENTEYILIDDTENITIKQGIKSGEKIILYRRGDEKKNYENGDVLITINFENAHNTQDTNQQSEACYIV